MELTRATDYALRGILYLSMQPRDSLSVISEIASQMDIPEGFLARIFQNLAKSGLIRSHRGKKGGFSLSKPPAEIDMKTVIEAMEGPIHLNRCLDGFNVCSRESLCPLHEVWERIQNDVTDTLAQTNFEELARKSAARMTKKS